jgi:hypothetical protein
MYKDVAQNLDIFVIKYPKTIIPKPTEDDYKNSFIDRYFVRKANDEYGHIFEIDESIFNDYSKNPFWISASIRWRISGPLDPTFNNDGSIKDKGVIGGNKSEIAEASRTLKNISLYLPNLLQFYRK